MPATIDWASVQVMVVEFAPVLIGAVILFLAVAIDRAMARWRIRRVARRLGATVEREPGRLYPELSWSDGPRRARLAFPRKQGALVLRATHCTVELELPVRLSFTIHRRGLLSQATLWFWVPTPRAEVRTGHDVFDRAFVVRGSDPAVLREWLTRDVRRALLRLAGNVNGHTVRIEGDGARITASLDGAVTDRKALRFFAETAVWVARAVEAVAVPQAVGFATDRHGSTFTLHACPACAEPVEREQAYRCSVCAAAHHASCFEYLGGCGVWGCAGGAPRHTPSAA